MKIGRRSFLGSATALVGCSMGGMAMGQGRSPVTREEVDATVLGIRNAPRFNCSLATRVEEGPFYNPSSFQRRDITEGRPGEALRLRISLGRVMGRTECIPLVGAVVDIWQADASGLYSNIGPNLQWKATPGETFMRGHQITDAQGNVEFDTVVPGWEIIAAPPPRNFAARTTHIHAKVFHEWQVFDTQLYFPDPLIDELYSNVEPYRSFGVLTVPGSDRQVARIRNSRDSVYNGFDESVSQQAPMEVERVDGKLVANATIGWLGAVNRGVAPLFR